MTAQRENVAIFNPLVLPLPSWHPDGPDGDIDGFVIPFVMPAGGPIETDNRHARMVVKRVVVDGEPTDWEASPQSVDPFVTYTAAQARAYAGAWIRAAEILDNVGAGKAPEPADDHVVDAEVVEDDDEDQDDDGCRCNSFGGNCPEHGPR